MLTGFLIETLCTDSLLEGSNPAISYNPHLFLFDRDEAEKMVVEAGFIDLGDARIDRMRFHEVASSSPNQNRAGVREALGTFKVVQKDLNEIESLIDKEFPNVFKRFSNHLIRLDGCMKEIPPKQQINVEKMVESLRQSADIYDLMHRKFMGMKGKLDS